MLGARAAGSPRARQPWTAQVTCCCCCGVRPASVGAGEPELLLTGGEGLVHDVEGAALPDQVVGTCGPSARASMGLEERLCSRVTAAHPCLLLLSLAAVSRAAYAQPSREALRCSGPRPRACRLRPAKIPRLSRASRAVALGARRLSAHGAGAVTPRLPAAWPPGSAALLASSPNGAAPWGGAVMPWARGCRPSPDDTTLLLSGRGHRGSVVRGSMASTSTEQASEPRHCRHRHLPDLALLAKSSPPWLPTSAAASRVVLHRY